MVRRYIRIAPTAGACLLLALCGVWSAVAAAADQAAQEPAPSPSPTPAPTPTPEDRPLVLLVTVLGLEEATESPLSGASVQVFAEDHESRRETDTAGKVTFKFTTKATTMMLRVTAAAWQSQQMQLEIDSAEKTHKIVLRPSN